MTLTQLWHIQRVYHSSLLDIHHEYLVPRVKFRGDYQNLIPFHLANPEGRTVLTLKKGKLKSNHLLFVGLGKFDQKHAPFLFLPILEEVDQGVIVALTLPKLIITMKAFTLVVKFDLGGLF